MPNRVLKDSIKRSSEIDSLTWFQEVVFYRLVTTVDDNGCYHANPQILRSDLFPLKEDMTKAAISEALDKLESVGLIKRYEVDSKPYLMLTTWANHQRIRNKTHHFPEPPWQIAAGCGDSRRIAADCNNSQNNEKDVAANRGETSETRGETRPESKNPRIQESKNPNTRDAADSDMISIQREHDALFEEAKKAGLPLTDKNMEFIIRLYADYGYETVSYAIEEAAIHNKVSIAYMGKVCQNYGKERPSEDDDLPDISTLVY